MTDNKHDACAASVAPHVLAVTLKSPVTTGAVNAVTAPPVFETVIICAAVVWFTTVAANVSDPGVNTTAAGAIPVPLNDAVCVPASSVNVSAPFRTPLAVGVNTTDSEHEACAASVVPQVLALTRKSPITTGTASELAVPPVFETVIVCAAALWPTTVATNVSAPGASTTTAGAIPVPVSEAVCVPAASVTDNAPFRTPPVVGVNTTDSKHDACAANVVPHVLALTRKSPTTTGTVKGVGVPPVFETVIICAAVV